MALEVWKVDFSEYQVKIQEYANFRSSLYSLVMGQCTQAMQEWLKSHQDFPAAHQNRIALLIIIESLVHSFEN